MKIEHHKSHYYENYSFMSFIYPIKKDQVKSFLRENNINCEIIHSISNRLFKIELKSDQDKILFKLKFT